MGIAATVKSLVSEFDKENPTYKGKAYLTSGDRSWQDQLDIILEPKRAKNYPNIKKRFLAKFKLEKLPADRADLTTEQLSWWQKEIMAQAGKPDGFAHVGGKAQDVSVSKLDKPGRAKLKEKLETKVKILMEKVTGTDSVYGVSIDQATVFHCY
jgi:hypothetical protein